jgi:hypothetical protein
MRMEYRKRARMKMNREELLKEIVISNIGRQLGIEENEWYYKRERQSDKLNKDEWFRI